MWLSKSVDSFTCRLASPALLFVPTLLPRFSNTIVAVSASFSTSERPSCLLMHLHDHSEHFARFPRLFSLPRHLLGLFVWPFDRPACAPAAVIWLDRRGHECFRFALGVCGLNSQPASLSATPNRWQQPSSMWIAVFASSALARSLLHHSILTRLLRPPQLAQTIHTLRQRNRRNQPCIRIICTPARVWTLAARTPILPPSNGSLCAPGMSPFVFVSC